MVGDSWERAWIKDLSVLDMSDGQSAVMSDILRNKTSATTAQRHAATAPGKKEAIISVEGDAHDHHHHDSTRGGTTRSLLHSHSPGKCQHAMASQNKVPARLMRLLMTETGKDQPMEEVREMDPGVSIHGT